jgi:hypothetical protein
MPQYTSMYSTTPTTNLKSLIIIKFAEKLEKQIEQPYLQPL